MNPIRRRDPRARAAANDISAGFALVMQGMAALRASEEMHNAIEHMEKVVKRFVARTVTSDVYKEAFHPER